MTVRISLLHKGALYHDLHTIVINGPTGLQWAFDFVRRRSLTLNLGSLVVTIVPAAIREYRNEAGDVLNQAILYYSQFLSQALADHRQFYNFNTSFPRILMVDMGMSLFWPFAHVLMDIQILRRDSIMWLHGMVNLKGVRVEPLALGLNLATHLKENNTRHTMAS